MKDIGEPLNAIIVPVDGGGLIAGISVAMRQLSPDTEVIVSCIHATTCIIIIIHKNVLSNNHQVNIKKKSEKLH